MNYDEFLKKEEQIQALPDEEQKKFYAECLENEQDFSSVRVHASYSYGALFFWEGNFRKTIDIVEPVVMNYQSFPFSKN